MFSFPGGQPVFTGETYCPGGTCPAAGIAKQASAEVNCEVFPDCGSRADFSANTAAGGAFGPIN